MDFKSINEIIDFAIEKEREAAAFYRSAADKEPNKSVQEMLLEYAVEEDSHEKRLETFKADPEAVTNYKFTKIQDLKRSDYLVDLEVKPGMTFREIMRVAMKREEKAHKLYEQMAIAADTDEQSNFFSILANEEMKHKNSLEKLYDDFMATQDD